MPEDAAEQTGTRAMGLWRSHWSIFCSYAARVWSEFWEDRILSVAAGVTFFVLLALFPAVASIVSLYGLFADRASIAQVLHTLSPYLPGGAVTVLGEDLHRLVNEKPIRLNVAFFFGSAIALWSASGGISALIDGLDVAFEAKETRGFLKMTRDALLFTVAGIIAGALAAYFVAVVPLAIHKSPYVRSFHLVFEILRWPAAFGFASFFFALVYHVGPDRKTVPPHWITWGSSIGAVLWILGTLLFSWYVQNFGTYDRTYGSLGAAVGFLTWIWISLVILLLGAEIDCEIERRLRPADHARQ
ncbi:MAG TPA: YihY/virulence factor BrkB family protein [Rhizomicrobium sp.]|nr:YihY/virulence factor BrkB family protein [Rhizomicrobium sp.]